MKQDEKRAYYLQAMGINPWRLRNTANKTQNLTKEAYLVLSDTVEQTTFRLLQAVFHYLQIELDESMLMTVDRLSDRDSVFSAQVTVLNFSSMKNIQKQLNHANCVDICDLSKVRQSAKEKKKLFHRLNEIKPSL